ncbi:hypothetical protein AXG93_285s1020 [Marchantia polymorpha subsp. ruderalis]|uniref:Uncharacterized protein n=1 Tax=Marchantia polymorpha subsp. ruderalis TaxID=1480154 RepID=A0A176VU90_MARPO|nr:hypothetical protein AXG93_285s1020 [Marchantia polymorpha subsp. ruderalis]
MSSTLAQWPKDAGIPVAEPWGSSLEGYRESSAAETGHVAIQRLDRRTSSGGRGPRTWSGHEYFRAPVSLYSPRRVCVVSLRLYGGGEASSRRLKKEQMSAGVEEKNGGCYFYAELGLCARMWGRRNGSLYLAPDGLAGEMREARGGTESG